MCIKRYFPFFLHIHHFFVESYDFSGFIYTFAIEKVNLDKLIYYYFTN